MLTPGLPKKLFYLEVNISYDISLRATYSPFPLTFLVIGQQTSWQQTPLVILVPFGDFLGRGPRNVSG